MAIIFYWPCTINVYISCSWNWFRVLWTTDAVTWEQSWQSKHRQPRPHKVHEYRRFDIVDAAKGVFLHIEFFFFNNLHSIAFVPFFYMHGAIMQSLILMVLYWNRICIVFILLLCLMSLVVSWIYIHEMK